MLPFGGGMEIKMDIITERYQLSCNRIKEIVTTQEVAENYKEFFQRTANFILMVVNTCDNRSKIVGLEALRAENKALYNDILDEQYNNSYANPSYSCAQFGQEMGRLLSFLYTEIRAMIPYAFEQDFEEMVIRMELFVEIYYAFSHAESEKTLMALPEEAAIPNLEDIKDTLYWFVSDYSETSCGRRIRNLVDADCDFAVRIVMDSDLSDLRYLYHYGEYVSPA